MGLLARSNPSTADVQHGSTSAGVLNLRRRDLRLDAPYQVRLTGKGNKVRLCPTMPCHATGISAV